MSLSPPRLRDEHPGVGRLVSVLRREQPDPDLVAKVLALPDRVPAPATPSARSTSLSSMLRWLAVGGCALSVGAMGWAPRAPSRTALERPSAPSVAESSARAEESASPAPAPPTLSVDDLPSAADSPRRAPARPRARTAARSVAPKATGATRPGSSPASTFHEELALIEAARGALARGDGETCLRTLDRYDERFDAGALASEAAITRIEALANVGRTGAALAAADRFLTQNAGSPYADRVRSVVERVRVREAAGSTGADSKGPRR